MGMAVQVELFWPQRRHLASCGFLEEVVEGIQQVFDHGRIKSVHSVSHYASGKLT